MKLICLIAAVLCLSAWNVDASRQNHRLKRTEVEESLPFMPFSGRSLKRSKWLPLPDSPAVDLVNMASEDVRDAVLDSIVAKKNTKVINLLESLLSDCKVRDSAKPLDQSLGRCQWKTEIQAASNFVGRKLQKELDEPEPDADDLAEKLQWLQDNDALPLLNITNPVLVRSAINKLDHLSSMIVTEATDVVSNKKHRPEVFFLLALPAAGTVILI